MSVLRTNNPLSYAFVDSNSRLLLLNSRFAVVPLPLDSQFNVHSFSKFVVPSLDSWSQVFFSYISKILAPQGGVTNLRLVYERVDARGPRSSVAQNMLSKFPRLKLLQILGHVQRYRPQKL